MPLETESGVAVRHAATVVDDLYQCSSGVFDNELYFRCAGVDSVFEQFFDSRCRAVHHLASRYLVGDTVRKYVDNIHSEIKGYRVGGL